MVFRASFQKFSSSRDVSATPSYGGRTPAPSTPGGGGLAPLLLHFDVNKTIIQSDSIQNKAIEEGVREGVADLFWGRTKTVNGRNVWVWSKNKPCCNPPVDLEEADGEKLINYSMYCRNTVKDKADRKAAIKSFSLIEDMDCKEEMQKVVQVVMKRMELPPEVRFTKAAEECGLNGNMLMMFPTIFHFVAALQRSKRTFAVMFRSFGADHEKIKDEWNAFCEMRHPLYSSLIQGIGPMDGSVPGIPDRRIHTMHTIYRDADGPVLVLNTLTNGPEGQSWDSWAKSKPKPKADTRNGRSFINKTLKAKTVEGFGHFQKWMRDHLMSQGTSAIKDDWAWWQWHEETAHAGKVLTVIGGKEDTKQLFFDDNVDFDDARIVDCRSPDGQPIPAQSSLNRLCTKVNPVEAMLDNDYFLRKLQVCHGEHLEMGNSLIDFQRQLTEVEEKKAALAKQVKSLNMQLKNLTEENRRMKLLHRITVRDEAELTDLLAKDPNINLDQFGKEGRRSVKELFSELEQGHCWLEQGEKGLERIFEMCFLKVQYKDMVLIESHEQMGSSVQSRSFLPGVRKMLGEADFHNGLHKWMTDALEVGGQKLSLQDKLIVDSLPIFVPEAPNQVTQATLAYPMACRIQHSQASYIINEKSVDVHKDLFGKLGLPGGKHFTTQEKDNHGAAIARFYRWDKLATFEASASTMAKPGGSAEKIDIAKVCEKLFKDHPRREVYENLLLQMFEIFTAQKLCGGFSGSIVVRCQPFETDGRPGEPCIVKLDAGDAIREEFVNSVNVFAALPDRAARILGDACYAKNSKGEEYGAMKLELVGACWNVPELAQSSASLLFTFKDLLLYESEQMLLGSSAAGGERPFGNVNSVLAETFGPGGVVSALRKGGKGLARSNTPLFWGWYTLKGKKGEFNPYTAPESYPPEPAMRSVYKSYFGGSDLPDLPHLVEKVIAPKLKALASDCKSDMCPLIALAHGDLNAANIMIDALDAVWLIDFATSVDLPLFTDMCKFEMACLFEYATIPITPALLVGFASRREEMWTKLCIGDWLRVDMEVAILLMRELIKLSPERLDNISKITLDSLIQDVATKKYPVRQDKQHKCARALKARLTTDKEEMESAFRYVKKCSDTLLQGDYLIDTLNIKGVPNPEGNGAQGAASLRFFMDISLSIRRFMTSDVLSCLRDMGDVQPCDATSLNLWLPFLRESYRIIGYKDISPQQKLWSIYHCECVGRIVLRIVDDMSRKMHNLSSLPIMSSLKHDMEHRKKEAGLDEEVKRGLFSESDSHWILHRKDQLAGNLHSQRLARKTHAGCERCRSKPGCFAPILEVLGPGDRPQRLLMDGRGSQAPLRIMLKELPLASEAGDNVIDMEVAKNGIGYYTPASRSGDVGAVTLNSRLLQLTPALLQYTLGLKDNSGPALSQGFSIFNWCEGAGFLNGVQLQMPRSSQTMHQHQDRATMSPTSPQPRPGQAGAAQSFTLPEETVRFLALEATVVDGAGKEVTTLQILLGVPATCYPVGSKICLDTSTVAPGKNGNPEMVVLSVTDAGAYRISDAPTPTAELERDFDPVPGNHVWQSVPQFELRQRVVCNDLTSNGSWMDADVVALPSRDNGYRYTIKPLASKNGGDSASSLFGAGDRSKTADLDMESQPLVDRHLHTMNSGQSWLSGPMYEEEVQKLKVYCRARHSFVIDALSGVKLDIKSCALPTLMLKAADRYAFGGQPSDASARTMSGSSNGSSQLPRARSMSTGGAGGSVNLAGMSQEQDPRHGWNTVVQTVERYEKKVPSTTPNAFLVLGAPGSGKSCLVNRLMMDCLERQMDLVPLLLPIADIVKRGGEDAESMQDMSSQSVQRWFFKYLQLTFGEDSFRYKMVRQAMCMRRVMFLFEGLEDGGALMPIVERLIKDIVLDRHLVVVTSRPLLASAASTLEDLTEFMPSMELQHLSMQQKKAVAQSRLGLEGLPAFIEFFKKLRQSQNVTGQSSEEEEEDDDEDVFGNPMMLSMLICYLQMRQKKLEEKQKEQGGKDENRDEEGVTLTAVYRVAVDVMLQRVQSKSQADRFNKEEKVEQCKRILGIMAMKMQTMQSLVISESDLDLLLKRSPELTNTWKSLKSAVVAGHAMFLRNSLEGGRMEYRFLVKGFQNFFAASCVSDDYGAQQLPALAPLMKNMWWSEMLEMLAEAWPHRYVKVIEAGLESFKPENGMSFLHLAAQVGHRPAFQLLKMFSETHQAALRARTPEQQTPMHVAAEKGNTQICALMLDLKAAIDVEDKQERLPMHVAMQNGHFQTAKFMLERWMETHPDGRGSGVYHKGENAVERLAARVLGAGGAPRISEEEFKEKINNDVIEMQFFGKAELADKKKTLGGVLAVYWIASNQYEQFVRGQALETRLTKASWDTLQEWVTTVVKLCNVPMVQTMLVLMAIANINKIKAFRKAFAPDFDDHNQALAYILQRYPVLVPTFSKLDEAHQQLAISALKADFNFGQFLQAENLPASLLVVKEVIGHSQSVESPKQASNNSAAGNILGCLLFRIFTGMCGVAAPKTLEGCLFMGDKMYNNFKVGLDVLQNLNDKSAHETYDLFLAERAKAQGLSLVAHDKESRAIVRLACLSRAFTPHEAKDVVEAFMSLEDTERIALTDYLNADGTKEKGFLLYFAPNFLENTKANQHITLADAMRILLRVYEMSAAVYPVNNQRENMTVNIMVDELTTLAKACEDPEVFAFTKFSIVKTPGSKSESQGSVHLSPWQLRNEIPDQLYDDADSFVTDVQLKILREPGFHRKVPQVFPEVRFFLDDQSAEIKTVSKQTMGAMLVIYWIASDQHEAFTRGHGPDHKLSDASWESLQQWNQQGLLQSEFLNSLFVALMIKNLGKIPKFKEQLAPNAGSPKDVMRHVMDTCPKVMPSFQRLSGPHQQLVRQCLTREFSIEQLLQCENLPASLSCVREMLGRGIGEEIHDFNDQKLLEFYTIFMFAELAGSNGESLEGSLYMTEQRYKQFKMCTDAMKLLGKGEGEVKVYNRVLGNCAEALGLSFDDKNPESRAIWRLTILAKVEDAAGALKVSDTLKGLDPKEKNALVKYLNADGINEKPGFLLHSCNAFLECAARNNEVGLGAAFRILLKVYDAAAREFQGGSRSVISIYLGRLVLFAQEFNGSVQFQDMPFELQRKSHCEALVIPKVWIPVTSQSLLDSLGKQGTELASEMVRKKLAEETFKARILRTYPELSYFPQNLAVQRDQTLGALLSVFWLISGQHEAFIRSQKPDEQLSLQSWAWIQEWMSQHVKLSREQTVDATLVFMAIHALGKIPEFREELAPGYDSSMHDVALAQILQTKPEVVPSFSRLDAKYKQLIVDSLSVDFQFSQFLQAENTPANLVVMKEKLKPHGDDGFAFFCFRVFAQMCGKMGPKTHRGSMFMTERQFQRFRPGLDALQQLRTLDANEAYNAFLLLRGSQAMSRFASPEHQALARLLCLGSAFDPEAGNEYQAAFDSLRLEERRRLTAWMNSDGIDRQPGYVLVDASSLFSAAKNNPHVSLGEALRMLLLVQDKCEYNAEACQKVIVHLEELASWAEDVPEPGAFLEATLAMRFENQSDAQVCFVEVHRPLGGTTREINERTGSRGVGHCDLCGCLLVTVFLTSLLLLLIAAGLFMVPTIAKTVIAILPDSMHVHIRPRRFGVLCAALATMFLFCHGLCRCQRRWFCPGPRIRGSNALCGAGSLTDYLLTGRGGTGYSRLQQEPPDGDAV
eukprot:TRINITY_DN31960_c0_g4_i1.p1 TRINITY_DN31960_c0_g4~~TRINITY_DN31960_c0_g4_i1.p1  ORF type:complete len:3718 (+),score=1051.51 TRINITY_DN31960_c0_g4_i1:107-11260(+)